MSVHFDAVTPMLVVAGTEPTRAFFCDRLGFAIVSAVEDQGTLDFLVLQRGDVQIMVQSEANLRADSGESYVPGPYKAIVYIELDDVEAFVPEVADADVVLPFRHTANGMHEIGVREPGGNIVIFASPVKL